MKTLKVEAVYPMAYESFADGLVHRAPPARALGRNPTSTRSRFRFACRRQHADAADGRRGPRWPIGTKQRLAFALLLYTGQRGSDVCRLTQPDVSGRLRVVQQKTGAKLVITVHRNLRTVLDASRGARWLQPKRPATRAAVLADQRRSPAAAEAKLAAAVRAAAARGSLDSPCEPARGAAAAHWRRSAVSLTSRRRRRLSCDSRRA